jgi:transcriptional regulator NrdR family protein
MSESSMPSEAVCVGLTCPKCGHQRFRVVYTRASRGGKVVRRRACRKCETRITTVERIVCR